MNRLRETLPVGLTAALLLALTALAGEPPVQGGGRAPQMSRLAGIFDQPKQPLTPLDQWSGQREA